MRFLSSKLPKKLLRKGLLVFFLALPAIAFAFQGWERAPQPPATTELTALLPHPQEPGKMIAASKRKIFEGWGDKVWRHLWQTRGSNHEIRRLLHFEELPDSLFILTKDGVFLGGLQSRNLRQIFRGKGAAESSVLSFAVLPGDPEHWFVGTEGGLLESDDAGRTWYRFGSFATRQAIPIVCFFHDRLFVATRQRLYISEDLLTFRPVFSLLSGDAPEFLEIEEAVEGVLETAPAGGFSTDLYDMAGSKTRDSHLWLGTKKGVFQSRDGGRHWRALSESGLRGREIRRLVYSEKSYRLFAAAPQGIYRYLFQTARWEELFAGLARPEARDLAVIPGDPETLAAATPDGLMRYPILVDEVLAAPGWNILPDKIPLFRQLISNEPTARDVHEAVIRYGNLGNGKIKRWHAESRLASFLPTFSFGKDFSKANNIDIDRGSTTEADRFISGPEDIDKGWDADVSWDLGDFIWSSSQTSIDSREKLMVELRNDLLAEATRIYYERRRLQTEIVFMPAPSEHNHLERLIRMDELTALLDSMTGGYFSGRLEKAYAYNAEFSRLWEYTNLHENGTKRHENPA